MELKSFKEGEQICAPSGEYVGLSLDGSGLLLQVRLPKPTAKEKNNFKSGFFSSKLLVMDNIIFFLTRFGTQDWMDTPYYHNLHVKNPLPVLVPHTHEGLALTVLFIDASTGILQSARLIGLSHEISMQLIKAVNSQVAIVDPAVHQTHVNSIYQKYSTQDMVELAGVGG